MKSLLKYFALLFSLNYIEGAFRCDYKYSSKTQTWFKLTNVPANFVDARLRCSLEGAVLASPTTPKILNEMRKIMNRSNPEYEIFTGIHATFSQEDFNTIEGTPLSKIPVTWAENEPDNKDNNERCITLNGNGDVADRSCEETRPYICYHAESFPAEVSQCGFDPEYYLDTRTNKCYKFHSVPRNFSRAFLACAAEEAHLAIINSDLEATVLKELFDKHPASTLQGKIDKNHAIIGFQDWGENWDFRTIHGQTLTEAGYNKFNEGEPNNAERSETCGSIHRSGLLNDLGCYRLYPFICEKSPGPSSVCHAPVSGQKKLGYVRK